MEQAPVETSRTEVRGIGPAHVFLQSKVPCSDSNMNCTRQEKDKNYSSSALCSFSCDYLLAKVNTQSNRIHDKTKPRDKDDQQTNSHPYRSKAYPPSAKTAAMRMAKTERAVSTFMMMLEVARGCSH